MTEQIMMIINPQSYVSVHQAKSSKCIFIAWKIPYGEFVLFSIKYKLLIEINCSRWVSNSVAVVWFTTHTLLKIKLSKVKVKLVHWETEMPRSRRYKKLPPTSHLQGVRALLRTSQSLTCHQQGWWSGTEGTPLGQACHAGPHKGRQGHGPPPHQAAGCLACCTQTAGRTGGQPWAWR